MTNNNLIIRVKVFNDIGNCVIYVSLKFIYLFEYKKQAKCLEELFDGCKIDTVLSFFVTIIQFLVTHELTKKQLFSTTQTDLMTKKRKKYISLPTKCCRNKN